MMKSFNVLNRQQPIHQHALLEASAGTGKTFAIENIIVRLLIEEFQKDPLKIEDILVVTFTRAATRDLKDRIQQNLERAVKILKASLVDNAFLQSCPDFLKAIIEKGNPFIQKAMRRLEDALFNFDRAQIFTIHGFCWRMMKCYPLEAEVSFESTYNEDDAGITTKLLQVVRDFLRTQLIPDRYSPAQLAILLGNKNVDKLETSLLQEVSKGIEIQSGATYTDLFNSFKLTLNSLKTKFNISSPLIMEDFFQQAPYYKGLYSKEKTIHKHHIEKIRRFATLFDRVELTTSDFDVLIKDGLFILEAFDPSQRNKKKDNSPLSLHLPDLLTHLRELVAPIVNEARNAAAIFLNMVADCREFINRYQSEEELYSHRDILSQMQKAIGLPAFAYQIRNTFSAVIVDEFQDTDPIQWDIFASLFLNESNPWKGYLYLVGDPKQSIYAFRQADIYTYLEAANKLGNSAVSSLDTNFRSTPHLVESLNVIFESAKCLFPLPHQSSFLPYRSVKAGKQESGIDDGGASVQFWIAKEKKQSSSTTENVFFSAITNEIIALKEKGKVSFSQCAVLIKDRHQARRISEFLIRHGIPVKRQKANELTSSGAFYTMLDLINGVLNFHQESALKKVLMGYLIGFNDHQLSALDEDSMLLWMDRFERLRQVLLNNGFACFYSQLMQAKWNVNDQSIMTTLLGRQAGYEFYSQWQDIADLLITAESNQELTPEGLINFLSEFEELSLNEDQLLKAYVDRDEEGVSILTTHVSKGLEYDVVFALGISQRSPKVKFDKPIVFKEEKKQVLGCVHDTLDPHFIKYCEEMDAEKMRQLYVAFTRARYRLYIPALIGNQSEATFGSASPIELLLARLNQTEADYTAWYERVNNQDGKALEEFISKNSKEISLHILDDVKARTFIEPEVIDGLVPPKEAVIPSSVKIMQSFTSLSTPKELHEDHYAPSEFAVPHNFMENDKTPHTLPSSAKTGIMLHHLLEQIPLELAKINVHYKTLLSWISPLIQDTPFAAWENVIAEMLFNAFQTPLPNVFPIFSLADLNPKRIYRETEFIYTSNGLKGFEKLQFSPGFIKGVVDLVFEHEGKYYLLDWKTNWLGQTTSHYNVEALEKCLIANQYDLQACIYIESLRRYLAIFNPKPFKDIFGGMYYVFLRGVGPKTGIVHYGL